MNNSKKNTPKYYSLAELSASIESIIGKTYRQSYWIKAEIAKLNYYPKSGHCYPDLVEKKDGKVKAQIRGTIWAGNYNNINKKFIAETKEALNDGMTVLFLARVTYNAVYGLSLQITDIEPSFTLGEMAKERIQSIEKLKHEGLFDNNKLKIAPLLIQRIAVISVETSKGYHDFYKTIDQNTWNYKIFHMLFPAVLQGEAAISSISEQLDRINKVNKHFDAVAIIRGGGGDIGLSSYDSYKLSRKVATFPLPVITGIGHATNQTVTELVAWENKITPTDVAYFLIQRFHNLSVRIENAQKSIIESSKEYIYENKSILKQLITAIKSSSEGIINHNYGELHRHLTNLKYGSQKSLDINKHILKETTSKLSFKPSVILTNRKYNLEKTVDKLTVTSKQTLTHSNHNISTLEGKLNLLKPENILKRGYSITLKNGLPITNTNNITVGDELETVIYKGVISSKVTNIDKNTK